MGIKSETVKESKALEYQVVIIVKSWTRYPTPNLGRR